MLGNHSAATRQLAHLVQYGARYSGCVCHWVSNIGVCREREDEEVEWKPTCVVHLTRPEGGDLGGMRTCFNLKDTLKTTFFVGSTDGELVYADWIKPEVSTTCSQPA